MRYPASEKLEIIRLVEQSHLPAKHTLDKLGIPRSTFYAWYDKYLSSGVDALEDKAPMPCLGPLKLCHYLSVTGGTRDGPETVFR